MQLVLNHEKDDNVVISILLMMVILIKIEEMIIIDEIEDADDIRQNKRKIYFWHQQFQHITISEE